VLILLATLQLKVKKQFIMPHMAHTLDTSKQSSILFPKAKKRMPKKRIKKSEKNEKKTTVQHIFVLIFYDFMSLLYN
jgi:hypothetical protein